MNPLLTQLSPLERRYFKLYIQAARKDFDVLTTAAALMQPNELAISCPIQATRIAEGLYDLQANFVGALTIIAHRQRLRRRPTAPYPSEDDLAQLAVSSFFKVVAVINSSHKPTGTQKDAGWFSGAAEEWAKSMAAFKLAWAPQKNDPFSGILSAIMQLFYASQNSKLSLAANFFAAPAQSEEEEEWYDDEDDDMSAPEETD